jgi:GDP-D-mannose 3', 5'-epimerase
MRFDYYGPLNLGQNRMMSIGELVDIVADIAGIRVVKRRIDGPQSVRGRNSDNALIWEVLMWEPQISLEEGLCRTYRWIEEQARCKLMCGRVPAPSEIKL